MNARTPLARAGNEFDDLAVFLPAIQATDGRVLLADGSLLTAREVEVLYTVWLGLSNREAADRLALSVSSVRQYLQRLRDRLGVSRSRMAVLCDRIIQADAIDTA